MATPRSAYPSQRLWDKSARGKGKPANHQFCATEPWDGKVIDQIAPQGDEIIFPKSSSSVFVSTHIDYVLRNLGVRQLVISGLITDQCVESAIRDACDLGYLVTQVTDACLTYTQERHENSLRTIKGYCRQVTTSKLVEELGQV